MQNQTTIYIASDHAGYDLRLELVSFLAGLTIEKDGKNDGGKGEGYYHLQLREIPQGSQDNQYHIIDLGPLTNSPCDYPDYADMLAQNMKGTDNAFGILLCGSGIGMNIAANRYKHLRAALCHSVEYARLARAHNNANVLVLGARFTSRKRAAKIIQAFMTTEFDARHVSRVDLLSTDLPMRTSQ